MAVALTTPPGTCRNPLLSSSNPELRRLVLEETDDTVILRGRVSSFYMKQMAQETLREYAEGRSIINRVEVYKA